MEQRKCTCRNITDKNAKLLSELELPIMCQYCINRMWKISRTQLHDNLGRLYGRIIVGGTEGEGNSFKDLWNDI